MADKTPPPAAAATDAPPKPKLSIPIVPILNTLAMLGAAGLAVYSKLLYKRPPILEETERERLFSLHSKPEVEASSGTIAFGPITANIATSPEKPQPADGTFRQLEGKLHYVTLSFSLEIRDQSRQDVIDAIRTKFLDKLNQILGKKQFNELTSVQGRYLLQSQLVDAANQLVASNPPQDVNPAELEGLVTHIFFTQFIVQ